MEHVTVKEQRSSKKRHGLGTPKSKGDLCAVFRSKNDRWFLEKYVLFNVTLIFRNLAVIATFKEITERLPSFFKSFSGHPKISLISPTNLFSMASLWVKRSLKIKCKSENQD